MLGGALHAFSVSALFFCKYVLMSEFPPDSPLKRPTLAPDPPRTTEGGGFEVSRRKGSETQCQISGCCSQDRMHKYFQPHRHGKLVAVHPSLALPFSIPSQLSETIRYPLPCARGPPREFLRTSLRRRAKKLDKMVWRGDTESLSGQCSINSVAIEQNTRISPLQIQSRLHPARPA